MRSHLNVFFLIALAALLLSFTTFIYEEIKDYLSAGTQMEFNNEDYTLKWSSHPTENYYKQEYLRNGDTFSGHMKMMMLEAIEGDIPVKSAIALKVNELTERKKWDHVANFRVLENFKKPNEGIIDFVLSDTMTTYEWNLYRYQLQKASGNKHYLVLFAYNFRDSLNDNKDLKVFFDRIKSTRVDLINKLQAYPIPKVKIAK